MLAAELSYDELMTKTKDAEEVFNDGVIARIKAIHDAHVDTLRNDLTASLWIQYIDMVRLHSAQVHKGRTTWQLVSSSAGCIRDATLLGRLWPLTSHYTLSPPGFT